MRKYMDYNFEKIITGIKKGKYKLLGTGSSRWVYDLSDNHVIKVAKDIRGLYQNQAESKVYQTRKSNLFAEVVAISADNKCLIMSKATKIENINTVYKYYNVRNLKSLAMLDNLYEDMRNNKLSREDLVRSSSWGLVGGVPVIIDYGLTHDIYKKFYGLNSLFKRFRSFEY
jgi:hypothetical protein